MKPFLRELRDNPYRLWDLLEMLYSVDSIACFGRMLMEMSMKSEAHAKVAPDAKFTDRATQTFLEVFENTANELNLTATGMALHRLIAVIKLGQCSFSDFERSTKSIGMTFQDELGSQTFLYLPPPVARYYTDGPNEFFSENVYAKFPSIADDMDDASKCYALEQSTASAFHSLAVVEAGMKAVCSELGVTIDLNASNCTWNKMLQAINGEILPKGNVAPPRKTKQPATWDTDEIFFNGVVTDLTSMQKAFRNPTVHFRRRYDQPGAKRILNAVSGFIEHVSERLGEVP